MSTPIGYLVRGSVLYRLVGCQADDARLDWYREFYRTRPVQPCVED